MQGGDYPFVARQTYTPDYTRDYMHLRAEMAGFRSMLRVRHAATNAFHRYFDLKHFTCIHTPVLTSNSCEGAGEVKRFFFPFYFREVMYSSPSFDYIHLN